MSIYFPPKDWLTGLAETPTEFPPKNELLESCEMTGERNGNYGNVGAHRGVYGKEHPRWGTKQSQKQKDAMSKARKGSTHSDEAKAKMRKAWEKRKLTFVSPFVAMHKYKRENEEQFDYDISKVKLK